MNSGVPVLTAGKTFILGYTDEATGIKRATIENPVIIFDDFTTESKLVDFDFKIKSSAIKLLTAKGNNDIYFLFNQLKKINYVVQDHQRHWIGIFQNFEIFLPSVAEQSKISNILQKTAELSSLLDKKLATLKKYKGGLTKKYLRETIDNWKSKENKGTKLKEFLIETKEYSENDGTLPHLTLSKDGVEPKTDRYDRDFLVNDEKKKYKITKINQLCYNPANLKFGVICVNHFGNGIFSPIYVTFRIQKIDIEYLEMILTSKDFVNYSLRFQEGTVYERMAVSVNDFLNIKIAPCSVDEQKLISNVLKSLQKIIELENQKLNILESIKNYFLNNMFV